MSPPVGDAHVAGSALYAMVSARSANVGKPCVAKRTMYDHMASTTPHSSMPREGDRVAGFGSNSSPAGRRGGWAWDWVESNLAFGDVWGESNCTIVHAGREPYFLVKPSHSPQ
eukprot:scaffold10812_cov28-Tisochrysis_lutea.AAC.3